MSKKLIDAEETIRNIIIAAPREPDEAIRATASAIVVIENMPSAQPERKKGKWILSYSNYRLRSDPWHKCDQCGNDAQYATNYCPSCGAAMREEKNVHYDNHSS